MIEFEFDIKKDKIESLASLYLDEDFVSRGIYHFQRNIPTVSYNELILVAGHDLAQVEALFAKGEISYGSFTERNEVKVLTLTMRLDSDSILKYVVSCGTGLKTRLRLNFSTPGRVIEYDDFHEYLEMNLPLEKRSILTGEYPFEAMCQRIYKHLEVNHD